MPEPLEFEPSTVVNDLPKEQGGLAPMPEGFVGAETVPETPPESDADEVEFQARGEQVQFKRGRRASSHDARPDDVPRISKLSAELREERVSRRLDNGMRDVDEILQDVYPKATDTERAAHRKHVEALVTAYQPKAKPVLADPPPRPVAPAAFAKPEPKLDDFANEPDPYQAHIRALGRWDAEKDAHARGVKDATAAHEAHVMKLRDSWHARIESAKAADPQWTADAHRAGAQIPVESTLSQAILLDDDGPAMLKFLASHQDVLDDLLLVSPAVNDATIAAMRRRLHSRMAGEKTGAPAPTLVTPSARPPSPVRTLTTTPADDAADPDDTQAHFERREKERRRGTR